MNDGEKKVVANMIGIYCSAKHKTNSGLCEECRRLLDYASERLEKCPFGKEKPTCETCSIHCYKPQMRDEIRAVMRFSGPRMLFKHPVSALRHLFKEKTQKRGCAAASVKQQLNG